MYPSPEISEADVERWAQTASVLQGFYQSNQATACQLKHPPAAARDTAHEAGVRDQL